MRVILIGTARQRNRLREQLDAAPDVVAEFETLGNAREARIPADAILLSPAFSDRAGEEPPLVEPLTVREIEVLELVAEGLSNKAVAERLGISDQTVKFHVASISGKLGASNRTDAVRRALRGGLITL